MWRWEKKQFSDKKKNDKFVGKKNKFYYLFSFRKKKLY